MGTMVKDRKRKRVWPSDIRKRFARAKAKGWTTEQQWRELQAKAMQDKLTERLLLHAARNSEADKKWVTVMLAIAYGAKWHDIVMRRPDNDIDR